MEQTVQSAGSIHTTVIQRAELNRSIKQRHDETLPMKIKEKGRCAINITTYVKGWTHLCRNFQQKIFNRFIDTACNTTGNIYSTELRIIANTESLLKCGRNFGISLDLFLFVISCMNLWHSTCYESCTACLLFSFSFNLKSQCFKLNQSGVKIC